MATFFKSTNVKVFPCAYRGKYQDSTINQNSTVDAASIYDPESRMQTEKNFVGLGGNGSLNINEVSGVHSENSYLISLTKVTNNNVLKFILAGYLFEVTMDDTTLDSLADKYLILKTTDINMYQTTTDTNPITTKVLKNLQRTTSESTYSDYYLDTDIDGEMRFCGLGIESITSTLKSDTLYIRPFEKIGNELRLFQRALLPNVIQHGIGTNSVTIGTGLSEQADNTVVVGKYNVPIDGAIKALFVVGDGTDSEHKHNAIAIGDTGVISLNSKDDINITAAGDNTNTIGGNKTTTVVGNKTDTINGSKTTKVTGDILEGIPNNTVADTYKYKRQIKSTTGAIDETSGAINRNVTGNITEHTTVNITETADNTLTLSGTVKAELSSDTNVDIHSAVVTIAGNNIEINKTKENGNINIGSTNKSQTITSVSNITNTGTISNDGKLTVMSGGAEITGDIVLKNSKLTIENNGAEITGDVTLNTNTVATGTGALYTDEQVVKSESFESTLTASQDISPNKYTLNYISTIKQDSKGKLSEYNSKNTEVIITSNSDSGFQGSFKIESGNENTSIYVKDLQTNNSPTFAGLTITDLLRINKDASVTKEKIYFIDDVTFANNIYANNIYASNDIVSTNNNGNIIGDNIVARNSFKALHGSYIKVRKNNPSEQDENPFIEIAKFTDESNYGCIAFTDKSRININSNYLRVFNNIDLYNDGVKAGCIEHAIDKSTGVGTVTIYGGDNTNSGASGILNLSAGGGVGTAIGEVHIKVNGGTTILSCTQASIDAHKDVYLYSNNISGGNNISAVSFTATSDARLKENIVDYKPEKSILDLNVYRYDFINGTKNQIGCIAQELREICPEIVQENNDGYLTIQESKLVYLLLDEVKKLRKEVNDLKEGR